MTREAHEDFQRDLEKAVALFRERRLKEPIDQYRIEFEKAAATWGFFAVLGALFGWRRVWDLNPRRLAPHTLSKRAHSAALATLLERPIAGIDKIG